MLKIYTIMFWFSVMLVLISIALLFVYGLNLGVDFRGGSVMEVSFSDNRPALDEIKEALVIAGLSDREERLDKDSAETGAHSAMSKLVSVATVNYVGDDKVLIRTRALSEKEHQKVLAVLQNKFSGIEEKRFDSIGPIIGNELKSKSVTAMLIVLAAVIIYIAAVFRKLSKTISPSSRGIQHGEGPVRSRVSVAKLGLGWVMGLAAIVALVHDVAIPFGVFAVLGRFYDVEISAVFVAAVLTILGYSVADSVVIFDRIRENIIKGSIASFPELVHRSVMQTLTRSLNTTLTTLLSLLAIYFFGGESIRYFALALIIGIFLGAYSSIFVASPLLVWWFRRRYV